MSDIEQAKKDFLPPPGWKRNPILLKLKGLDEYLSYKLAMAFDESSRLAEYRVGISNDNHLQINKPNNHEDAVLDIPARCRKYLKCVSYSTAQASHVREDRT